MAIIRAYQDTTPNVAEDAFLADTATLIGNVTIGPESSVWYGAVLRGDVGFIRVGARSNIQDLVCLHMTRNISNVEIGDDVTIGHCAIVHGAILEDQVLVGMGAVVLDNVRVGRGSVIAAGALLPPGMAVPERSMVRGQAAKVVRALNEQELERARAVAADYTRLACDYRD
jgi:carbonic anhydrase/acetyltransferase-like protein (isoleucine patch superfamily)